MSDKNFITFRIRYKVKYEEAVYIVLDCQQMNKYPVKMECNQMDKDDIWEVILQFEEDRDFDEEISYYYQVADFNNQNFVKYPITWQNSTDLMVRKFKREIYLNKSVIIFDSCNQKDLQISSSQDSRMSNKQIRNMTGKLIKINLCIKKKVGGEGRWIYGMPMPDKLVENFQETDFLKAVKLERIPTQRPNVFYWKKIWVFTLQQYEQLGGSTNFAFFQSYYYRRKVSDWLAILPNGTSAPLAQIAKMLEQSDTPYQIQVIDESNGEVIQSISYKTQDLYKQNFIYQISDDLDPIQIFQVYLVFENLNLGRYKMTRRTSNPKFWQVQVTLCKMDELPLYYFDVHNVIGVETNQLNRTNTFRYSYPDSTQNGSNRNINVNVKGSICQSHSYHSSQRYYSPPVTPRRQVKQTNIYYTYPSHTRTKISNTTSYYYNRRPEHIRSKLWNSSRTNTNSSSTSTSSTSTIHPNYNITNLTFTNDNVHNTSLHTPVISQNSSSAINTTYISNPSTFINTNVNNTYHDYQNYFKDTYPTQSTSYNTSSESHTYHSYSTPIVTRTQRNVYTVLNNASNYGDNVHRYYNNTKNLFNMTEQQVRYVKVRDFIDPIKLKLIKTSKIEQVYDKFEKQTQALIKDYPKISEKFVELKDLRAQLASNHKLQQEQIKRQNIKKKKLLFMIQLMTISKKWGKSKYSDQCQQELYQILIKYNLIRKQSQEIIFWILYYINQQTITKKYNQIACNSTCNKCGKQAKFQQELKKIMKQIQNKLNIKEVSKELIQKQKLYQNILECITSSYKQLDEYALNKQFQLFKNNTQECLMRTLLNYAIIYSIGRKVFSTNLFGAFKDDCGPFSPFCREMNNYISVFKWQDLQKLQQHLQNKNLGQLKQMEQIEISPLQIKLIQTQKQVVQQIQKTTNKELIDLINVTIDLDKAKKIMQEKNKNQLEIKCFINLYDDDDVDGDGDGDGDEKFSSLQKEIEQIDNIQDEKERFIRIRSLKNNRFEKAGFKFD